MALKTRNIDGRRFTRVRISNTRPSGREIIAMRKRWMRVRIIKTDTTKGRLYEVWVNGLR